MASRGKRSAAGRKGTRKQLYSNPVGAATQTPWPGDRRALVTGVLVVVVTGFLYWRTAARDILVGDTPEFITAAITLGVPHPPGYPLVTILGHLFSILPLGPMPFRVNLLSVVCGTVAVAVIYLTGLRLTGQHLASAAAALVLAFSTQFWEWSLAAEVFALSSALAATIVYLLVRWQERPERTPWLIAAAFLTGLAMTNQLTIVLLSPAIILLLWFNRAVLLTRPRIIAFCLAAILLGLLPYAYIPWAAARHPVVNWGGVASLSDLLDLFLRKSYGTGQLVSSSDYSGGSAVQRVLALFASFGLLTGLLVISGAVKAYLNKQWYFWFAILAFVFTGPAFIAYANLNLNAPQALYVLERFFLLSRVVIAPLMAFGVLLIAEGLAKLTPRVKRHAVLITSVGVLIVASGGVIRNYRVVDQSKNHVARNFAEDILATAAPHSVLLAGGDDIVLPLIYVQTVEGQRPDVTLVILPLLSADWYVRQLRERHPDLVIPFDRYDKRSTTIKSLVQSNSGRPIALMGNTLDDSLKGFYWFNRRGLIYQLESMSRDVKLSEMVKDYQHLLTLYRTPSPDSIKLKSFELGVLRHYAAPALKIGEEYEKARLHAEARSWYQRALAIAPDLPPAREALGRLTP